MKNKIGLSYAYYFSVNCRNFSSKLSCFVGALAAQAHASTNRGIYQLYLALNPGRDLRDKPVLGYKRPFTI